MVKNAAEEKKAEKKDKEGSLHWESDIWIKTWKKWEREPCG